MEAIELADAGPGLVDPIGFVVNTGLIVVAAYLFIVVLPRLRAQPPGAPVASRLALLVGLAAVSAMFVALPFVLAGAAIALGLVGRRQARTRMGTAAIALGVLVTLMATGYLLTA